jgi:ribonuclease J
VTAMPVDHDVPGALAFLIDTPDGVIAYSGDLRAHGYRPQATGAFVAAAAARRPRALVIETTRMGEEPEPTLTEAEVIEEMVKAGAEAAGLALVVPYPRNLERLHRLPEAARRMQRRLVVEAGVAAILGKPGADHVVVYGDESPSGRDGAQPAPSDDVAAEIRRDPREYLVQLSYARLASLVDLQPPPGSVLLHSDGEPIGSFDPASANLLRWLDHFRIGYRVVRSSGHAAPAELVRIAGEIGPQLVFPLHGLRPDLLLVPGRRQVLPVADVAYGLDGSSAAG